MALVQTTIDDDVKARADKVFARSGLTSAMAMRVMLTQVANTGTSPFDGLFSTAGYERFSDEVRRAMLREEAKEYGLIPDDSFDATTMPDDVLDLLGVTADQVAL
ncbi:acyl carrier protein [Eggerthellaceae bacterium zg-893]|nr:acyl carrier protein [Eggerthellaceae bacterium zg-893]